MNRFKGLAQNHWYIVLLAGSMKANFLALLVAAVSFTAGGNCAECISRDDAIHAGVHMLSTSGGGGGGGGVGVGAGV